jgi:hypothetical protein
MGVWSTTTPAGSDPISEGDDRLRELKSALQEALSHEDSIFPGATPLSTPIFIPGFLRGVTGSRPTGDSLVSGRIYFNTTTNVIERYNGATWDTIFTLPADASITATQLAASVAGAGLAGGAGTVLSVNVDGSTLEIPVDTLQVKDAGITAAKLAAAVAGDGLAGGAGTALSVNVDNSSIEINADTLRVKALGITEAMLAAAVVAKLSAPKSIQHFTTTISHNFATETPPKTTNQTITSIDTTNAYIVGISWQNNGTAPQAFALEPRLKITSATNVEIEHNFNGTVPGAGIFTYDISYTVVEWY